MNSLLQAIGGLGLFLLGMIIMTEALRSLAGKVIRNTLFQLVKKLKMVAYRMSVIKDARKAL